jgi:membrane-associated phospholipid phosphatase
MSPSWAGAVRPVEWLLAGYNAITALAWLTALGRTPAAPWIFAAHALGALMPRWLAAADHAPSRLLHALREAYPLLLLYPLYAEVGLFHAAWGATGHDATVAAWDRALFAVPWHAAWALAAPGQWMSELMHALYFLYYPLIALPPIAAAVSRRWDAFRDISARMMLTYVTCYAIYFAFPTFGPMHADPLPRGAAPQGLFADLVRGAADTGDSPGTAFPSSHVAGAFTAAGLGFRWHPRAVASLQAALAAGVALATVYTRNHYAIDALAGAILGAALHSLVAPAVFASARTRGRGRRPPDRPA